MYFFDLADYYGTSFSSVKSWYEVGVGGYGGCATAFLQGGDIQDAFGTARETSNAFFMAIDEWYVTVSQSGYTQAIDNGCSPSYADLYDDFNQQKINFIIKRDELQRTYILYDYFYETMLELNPSYGNYPTHNSWITHWLNIGSNIYMTGSTNGTIRVYNPYTLTNEDVTVTFNYGTSFEHSDFVTKIDNYEESLKQLMCSLKNVWAGIDGDTFDELVVDENGGFVSNSGTTYCLV